MNQAGVLIEQGVFQLVLGIRVLGIAEFKCDCTNDLVNRIR